MHKKHINEKNSNTVKFLYKNIVGRLFLNVINKPAISKMAGYVLTRKVSSIYIKPFVKKNNINMELYEDRKFKSYNDFFTRELKEENKKIDKNKNSFISPCDSKLSIYEINDDSIFEIKDSYYKVEDLVNNKEIADKYKGGYCLIFRLTVDDYHRYCYIDDGSKDKNTFIKGVLYTVQPIALENYNIYKRNSREYTTLKTKNFGEVVQIEVGATIVGKIKNFHEEYTFKKGEEKGMFLFGGSTIVLLVQKDKVIIDQEIIDNTNEGYETVVKYGSKIGKKKLK